MTKQEKPKLISITISAATEVDNSELFALDDQGNVYRLTSEWQSGKYYWKLYQEPVFSMEDAK